MADLEVYGHNGCVYKVCLSYSAYGVNDDLIVRVQWTGNSFRIYKLWLKG